MSLNVFYSPHRGNIFGSIHSAPVSLDIEPSNARRTGHASSTMHGVCQARLLFRVNSGMERHSSLLDCSTRCVNSWSLPISTPHEASLLISQPVRNSETSDASPPVGTRKSSEESPLLLPNKPGKFRNYRFKIGKN